MRRTIDAGNDILLSYATPVLARVFDNHAEINGGLSDAILLKESESSGVARSNVGGWHSENDFMSWDCSEIHTLRGWLSQGVKAINDYTIAPERVSDEMDVVGWANVCRKGDYHQPHHHPSTDWSAVYYVATGVSADEPEDLNAGRIEMMDPRTGSAMLDTPDAPFLGRLQFKPQAGMLLVFPGWLTHWVHPHGGKDARISIAFNARIVSTKDAPPAKRKRWFG